MCQSRRGPTQLACCPTGPTPPMVHPACAAIHPMGVRIYAAAAAGLAANAVVVRSLITSRAAVLGVFLQAIFLFVGAGGAAHLVIPRDIPAFVIPCVCRSTSYPMPMASGKHRDNDTHKDSHVGFSSNAQVHRYRNPTPPRPASSASRILDQEEADLTEYEQMQRCAVGGQLQCSAPVL